jgi:hypothetical protein
VRSWDAFPSFKCLDLCCVGTLQEIDTDCDGLLDNDEFLAWLVEKKQMEDLVVS